MEPENIHKLSEERAQEIFENEIVPYVFSDATPVKNPKFILIGGQPGCGKTELVIYSMQQLKHNLISVDGDLLRPFHPDYMELYAKYGADASKYTHPDCARWSIWVIRRARKMGYNVILENTLRDINILKTIDLFHQEGYDVTTKVMVVSELESCLGIFQRYIDVYLANNPELVPRYSAKARHDETCNNIPITLEAIEAQGYSSIELFRRSTEIVERIAMVRGIPIKDLYLKSKDYPYTIEELKYLRSEIVRIGDFIKNNPVSEECFSDYNALSTAVHNF